MPNDALIANNRKARHHYELVDTFEAGMVLQGTEVKSLRAGKVNFGDAFCYILNGQIFVKSLHISPYKHGNIYNHEPRRVRKLLMHKREILRLDKQTKEKGLTIIPIKLKFSETGYAKIEIALARGKKLFDKRESLKAKDAKKNVQRYV